MPFLTSSPIWLHVHVHRAMMYYAASAKFLQLCALIHLEYVCSVCSSKHWFAATLKYNSKISSTFMQCEPSTHRQTSWKLAAEPEPFIIKVVIVVNLMKSSSPVFATLVRFAAADELLCHVFIICWALRDLIQNQFSMYPETNLEFV